EESGWSYLKIAGRIGVAVQSIINTKSRKVTISVESGPNLKIVGEPQYTFRCFANGWDFGFSITIENIGNEGNKWFMIWCHFYSDPNAVPDEVYDHESYMGAVGFQVYTSQIPAGSERSLEFDRSFTENEEGNECELVKNGKIVIEFRY
ncbi:unnamed protein product, partial [marine sediment metagenome]